jgi:hypothetical protein
MEFADEEINRRLRTEAAFESEKSEHRWGFLRR